MSKSDFLSWDDDLDDFQLEYLLGNYTDNEVIADHDDDDFINTDTTCKKPKTNKCSDNLSGYKCPVCCKILKTISGFRGHTSKQHGESNLKGMCAILCIYICAERN